MKIRQAAYSLVAAGAVFTALSASKIHAQPALSASSALPSSAADKSKPGFFWNISEVDAIQPNSLAWTEMQMAGLEGPNLADPNAVGVASAPAQVANPATAPVSFVIPTVINLSKTDQDTKGNFTPDGQMPGLPGSGSRDSGTGNAAAEALTYLDLPAGTITMAVNSDDGFKVTIGGANPADPFALNVGQFDGSRVASDTIFQFVVPQAGLYAARLLWENGGADANVEWFTIKDGLSGTNRVLVNDTANGGVAAYRAVTVSRAYVSKVNPTLSATDVVPNNGIHISLVDGNTPVAQSSISLILDKAPLTPTFSKNGNVTSIDYSPSAAWASSSVHSASLVYTDGSQVVTNSWIFTVEYYVSLDPSWAVTGTDTSKPGFNWNIYANSDPANTVNSNERAELNLSLLAVDATGLPLPNIASPASVGAATGPGVAPASGNGPVHFEIATTINLDIGTSTMPGSPSSDASTDGQAAEVLTYLSLPAGVARMEIISDDGWRLYAGAHPADLFGRAVVAEHNDGTGPVQFSFSVPQAGVYPFRLVWENGTGGSALTWNSVDSSGKRVLVNDLANGGIPAYRALTGTVPAPPVIVGAVPLAALHQQEVANTNLTVVLADGTNPIDDSSVTLAIDGNSVTPVKTRAGKYLTVSDAGKGFPGLQLAADVHTAVLTFKDSAGASRTQQWNFNNIQILILPVSPLKQENFDAYPEATSVANTVPPGWTAYNYTAENTPGWDLTAKSSDSYKNWILISSNTVTSIEGSALSNDPDQTINGQPVENFASGTVLWATSDGRSGVQAQFCTSSSFDLSAITNPVLIYSSLLRASGNANAQGDGIEYSVDGGKTWLPGIVYVTIAYGNEGYVKLLPDGSIDAVRTMNAPYATLNWVDANGQPGGGSFGSALAEPITQSLAPLMSPRSQNTSTSTKVDGFRLPGASKQKSVILRFWQVGNCSWWWGVDNLAFYDIAPPFTPSAGQPNIDSVQSAGGSITIKWSNGGTLESAPALTNPTWTSTGNSSGTFTEPIAASGNKFYRVRQ